MIYLYRDFFDPPTLRQQQYVADLAKTGTVYVVPADEDGEFARVARANGAIRLSEPIHRAGMADLAFSGIENVLVELCELDKMELAEARIVRERGRGRPDASQVVPAPNPPQPLPGDVPATGVLSYVGRHVLYVDQPASRSWTGPLDAPPRLFVVYSEHNEFAKRLAERFDAYRVYKNPSAILVIGGDGTMLHAVQRYWRCRVPFLGINAGHLGFLLNSHEEYAKHPFPPPQIVTRHLPMLHVDMRTVDEQGNEKEWVHEVTFNDAWIERAGGQSAWLQVSVDGRVRLPRLVGDGILVSTAAGSTAYARAMGAPPLLADTPAWLLVGNCVAQPPNWKSALLPMTSTVEVKSVDPLKTKRPLRGFAYGRELGRVDFLRARVSRVASVELAFYPRHDLTEKINDHMWGQIATF